MILVVENTAADDGTQVQSSAHFRIEDVGKVGRPFFVNVSVDHEAVLLAYCFTEAEAELVRERMHAVYLEVHRSQVAA